MLERRRSRLAYICDVCYAELATHETEPKKAEAAFEARGWSSRRTREGEPLHFCPECRSVGSPDEATHP